MISKTLNTYVKFCGPYLVFEAKDDFDLSPHAADAMEILWDRVDSNIINIISGWCSDEMLCYLHVQLQPIMSNFSSIIIVHRTYQFMHYQETPCF